MPGKNVAKDADGKTPLDAVGDFFKGLPKAAYGDSAEGAKAAGKIGGSIADCAKEEEQSFRAEDKTTADFYQECLNKAETPEERASVREEFAGVRERMNRAWHETRGGRANTMRGATKVALVASIGVAGILATILGVVIKSKLES